MLLIGNGTLCVMDAIDAGVRSGGNAVLVFTRLNLVAWYRLVMLVIKEICIRLGMKGSIDDALESFKRINEAISAYLAELKKIDIALFEEETHHYYELIEHLDSVDSEGTLNSYLLNLVEKKQLNKPWTGDFDTFMSNSSNRLVFE